MIRTAIKTTILLGLMGGSFYMGEKLHPVQTLTEKARYFRVEAAEGTPKDYLNWKTKIEIDNEKATLYFGNVQTDKWRKVQEDGMVGTFGEKIDEYLNKTKENIKQTSVVKEINSFGESMGNTIYDWLH